MSAMSLTQTYSENERKTRTTSRTCIETQLKYVIAKTGQNWKRKQFYQLKSSKESNVPNRNSRTAQEQK